MALNMIRIPFLIYCTTTLLNMVDAATVASSLSASRNAFATDIFRVLATPRNEENIVYSPASIQSCLTLALMGAEGSTAEQLRKGLKLGDSPKGAIAQSYADFITTNFKSSQENGPKLRMANGMFANQNIEIKPEFNKLAERDFQSKVEKLNFANGASATEHINSWVEEQTENKIQNLLTPDTVNQETSAILVNAIYFKGLWATQFSEGSTRPTEFFMAGNHRTNVDMMYVDDRFNYADLPQLNAKAIELPYQNTDLNMLIILPNEMNGLGKLEEELSKMDLNQITSGMNVEDVDVFLPKFKIEFDIDLKTPLKELGISEIFENSANFSGIFETKVAQKISEVRHKAFLSVNEAGSEAAAATFLKIIPMSLNLQQKVFRADHPFFFAIRNKNAVFFAGHVAKF